LARASVRRMADAVIGLVPGVIPLAPPGCGAAAWPACAAAPLALLAFLPSFGPWTSPVPGSPGKTLMLALYAANFSRSRGPWSARRGRPGRRAMIVDGYPRGNAGFGPRSWRWSRSRPLGMWVGLAGHGGQASAGRGARRRGARRRGA